MKRTTNLALAIVAIALALSLGSCEILGEVFGGLFNDPPTVSLAFTSGDANVWSDETVYLSATMSDPDDDPLDFTWYLDDVAQTATDVDIYYTAPSASADRTQVLKIKVTDGKETVQASITFNVTASATLIVNNNAYYSVYRLYVAQSSSTSWGTDRLGSSTLAIGSKYKLIGMTQGSWDIRYSFSATPTSYNDLYNNYFYKGVPRTLNVLGGGSWTSVAAGTIGSVEPGIEAVRQIQLAE